MMVFGVPFLIRIVEAGAFGCLLATILMPFEDRYVRHRITSK